MDFENREILYSEGANRHIRSLDRYSGSNENYVPVRHGFKALQKNPRVDGGVFVRRFVMFDGIVVLSVAPSLLLRTKILFL